VVAKSPVLQGRERGVCDPIQPRLTPKRVKDVTALFRLLADPTRVQIVAALRDAPEEVAVCDCTAAFDISQPTMSHHLAKLKEAGILEGTRRGVWTYYRLRPDLTPTARRIIEAL
jgi:ArsR family transcriptional regulator